VVSPTDPGPPVGSVDDGVGFVLGEEADVLGLRSPVGDGQDPLDETGVLRSVEGGVSEERPQGRQAGVSGRGAISPVTFEVIEEGGDHARIEVGEVHGGRGCARLLINEAQQEAKGVPVGGHGVGAGVALGHEPVSEKGLQQRSQVAHGLAAAARSRRSTARASSSGAACKYQ
jgi:hypothetical protein